MIVIIFIQIYENFYIPYLLDYQQVFSECLYARQHAVMGPMSS